MASPQYVYVEPEDSFPPNFICTVCHDVAGVHTACPGCSQTFCQSCVHRWFNTQKSNIQGCTCPYCRRKLKFSDLKHDAAVQQQLDQLMVYCPNKSAGCAAQLPRATITAHLSKECLEQECDCRFCGIHGPRRVVQTHEGQSCSMRLVPCSNAAAGCLLEVPLLMMPMHLEFVCEHQCRPCPQCNQAVARRDWSSHIQRFCPAKQYCPLRLYGCSFSGTADDVQQHKQLCSYLQQQQQLVQDSNELMTAAAVAYSAIDPGELPSTCLVDEYSFFKAPTVSSSAAAAGQMMLDAVPAAALPPKVHPQPDRLATLAALEAQQRPAALAGHTAPKVFSTTAGDASASVHTSSSGSGTADGMLAAGGVSPAEALAIGLPDCFRALGVDVSPEFESAWRIAQNMNMIDVLSSEAGELPPPSSFMLYTALIRCWDSINRITGRYKTALVDSEQSAQAGSMLQQQQQERQEASTEVIGVSSNTSHIAHDSSREQGQPEADAASESDNAIPGLERGLTEVEFDHMNLWLINQHKALSAVAAAVGCVVQLWISLGLLVLLPQAVELGQLAEAAYIAVGTLNTIAVVQQQQSSSRRTGSGSDGSSSRNSGGQQQQDRGAAAAGPLEAAAAGSYGAARQQQQHQRQQPWVEQFQQTNTVMGLFSRSLSTHSTQQQQQQQQQVPLGSTAGSSQSPRVPRGLGLGLGSRQKQQQQQQEDRNTAAAVSAFTSKLDFATAMQQLTTFSITERVHKDHTAQYFGPLLCQPMLSRLSLIELCTSTLVLHHLRAEHVDTSMIPDMPPQITPGCPGYWGVSILSVAQAQLGPGFRIGWQGLAVLNDMVSGLVSRVMQVLGEGFYDVVDDRVPLNPGLVMAAAQLLLPPGLVSACLPSLSVLSNRFHDEECEDLTEVTWQQLAARIGLKIELDKVVYVVEQRLPVTMEESDTEDDDEDDEDGDDETDDSVVNEEEVGYEQQNNARHRRQRSGAADETDSDSYVTDDEGDQQQQQQQRQQQSRTHVSSRTNTSAARWTARHGAAAAGSIDVGDEESDDDGWESADSDEVMELLGEQQQQQQQAEEALLNRVVSTGVSGASEVAAGCVGNNAGNAGSSGAAGGWEPACITGEKQQQQQQQLGSEGGLNGAIAEVTASMDWQHELEGNLQQLAKSSELSSLQQQVVCSAAQSLEWMSPDALQAFTLPLPGLTGDSNILSSTLQLHQHQQAVAAALQQQQEGTSQLGLQQQQNQELQDPTSNDVTRTAAAAAAVPAGDASRQQQPQRDSEAKDKDVGDGTTHGVVLIAGLVEFVLTQLLKGAAKVAAEDPAATAAAAAGCTENALSTGTMQVAGGYARDSRVGQQQRQCDDGAMFISARHVLLAAADDDDLKSIIIDRPVDQQHRNPAAAARSGVIPDFNMDLLLDPDKEPITAWLVQLGIDRPQHQQQQQCGDSCTAVIHPADLRYYCGVSRLYSSDAASRVCEYTAADDGGSGVDSGVSSVVCCWLSGWQCSACAEATATLRARSLEHQLDAALNSLESLTAGAASSSSNEGIASLSIEQLEHLKQMTRMFHLQQPWWYEAVDSYSSSTSIELLRPHLSDGDCVQLVRLQQLLKPLQDAAAIREIYLQQQQDRRVWPLHDFREQVYDAVENNAAQRRQQSDMQKQLLKMVVKPSSITAAAVAAGSNAAVAGDDGSSDGDLEDMDFDDEAMMLLATAAEDFLVQQFKAANNLALHAGRQQLTPGDLRLAMIQGGYSHLLPAATAGATVGIKQSGGKSLQQLLKRRRV